MADNYWDAMELYRTLARDERLRVIAKNSSLGNARLSFLKRILEEAAFENEGDNSALVRYWGKTMDKGSFNYMKSRRGYTLVPNKMINQKDDCSTKSFVQESPFRKQYQSKSLADSVGSLHAKMVGESLV